MFDYADAPQRRFAASMVVQALRTIQLLFDSALSDTIYFESVEALVWLCSPGSDRYFDVLGWDPEKARTRIDLQVYAELALNTLPRHRESMRRMYVAMARYSLRSKERKIRYPNLVLFSNEAVNFTELTLTEVRDRVRAPQKERLNLPAFLDILHEYEAA